MAGRRIRYGAIFLVVVAALGVAILFRQSLVPWFLSPLPRLDLANPRGWTGGLLIDWQLAELRYSKRMCRKVLKKPHIHFRHLPDRPYIKGCGWLNSVRVTRVGGAYLSASPLTCQVAAALAIWMEQDVQPLAKQFFGSRISHVKTFGTYSCRNIVGNPIWKDLRSQHAKANAIDIAGFRLANGKNISVLRDWSRGGSKAKFLRAVHSRACQYFRVALSPNFNAAHKDHFHFDRGSFWSCK